MYTLDNENTYAYHGGIMALGFPKQSYNTPLSAAGRCGTSGSFWELGNGRIYLNDENYWLVKASTDIGAYFYTNGADTVFGLPKGNEINGILASHQDFENAMIAKNVLSQVTSDPTISEITCGDEPLVCGNGIVEGLEVCDDGNTEDNDQCSSTCMNVCEEGYKWDGAQCVEVLACESSPYKLPWPGGVSYQVTQDQQNPNNSHAPGDYYNQWAWDFGLGVGSEIVSVESGTVKFIKINSSTGGCDGTYVNDANYIVIEHVSGKTVLYNHLQANSSSLKVGDAVNAGDVIAKTGLTGHICGAHLHFSFQTPSPNYLFSGWGESIDGMFVDASSCNNTYQGKPKYYHPNTTSAPYEDVDGDGEVDINYRPYFESNNY